jgi:predicted peptidase
MGGYDTWAYATAYPERFAAVVPVCGGGEADKMERLTHLPIWVSHGANDQIVPITRSAELVAELRGRDSDVRSTIDPWPTTMWGWGT